MSEAGELIMVIVRSGWAVKVEPSKEGHCDLRVSRGEQEFVITQPLDIASWGGLRLSLEKFIADGNCSSAGDRLTVETRLVDMHGMRGK